MSKGMILIVDDETDILRALNLRLRSNGYEVVTANDGETALSMALRSHPDVVILDIGLPQGDGYTVAQKMLENEMTRSIPIIFLTARTSEKDRERASHTGTSRYLIKPYEPEVLLETVDRAMTCVRPIWAMTQSV